MESSYISKLALKAHDIDIDLSELECQLMIRHLELVIDKNQSVNLTAIRNIEDGIDHHIIDSLLLLKYLEEAPQGTFCDIGTGAGFPGITLCIASKRHGLLIDSVGKKAAAVSSFIDTLSLENYLYAEAIRAEDLAVKNPKQFTAIVCRAVTSLPSIVELASPLLMNGGILIAAKGKPSLEEIDKGNLVAKRTGFSKGELHQISLLYSSETNDRAIIIYRKVADSKIKLPRRNGLAQSKPLA